MGIQFGLNESSEFAFVTQKILLLEMNSLHMIVKPISLTWPEFARWLGTEEMSRLLQMFGLEMFAKLLDIPARHRAEMADMTSYTIVNSLDMIAENIFGISAE